MLNATSGNAPASEAGGTDVIAVLSALMEAQIPGPGETLVFDPLPSSFPPARLDVPHGDVDHKMLGQWGILTLFTKLSLETILQVLCAILMERSVVVICSDLGALSAVMLAFLPLIRPFKWQGMFCPVLPESLHDFLDSPVPLLVGVMGLPTVSLDNNYLIYLNLDSDVLQHAADQPIPPIANQAQLSQRLEGFHSRLNKGHPGSPKPDGNLTKEEQSAIVDGILTVMKLYYISLLDMLQARAIVSAGQDDGLTANMLRKRVADEVAKEDRAFMRAFLETQVLHALCSELYHDPALDAE